MPQEIEVWLILPAIRRELAKSMINDYNLSQKEIAKKIGVTEAAVSQYVHSKRAKNVDFSDEILKEIKTTAGDIIKNDKDIMLEIIKLCKSIEVKKVVCGICKTQDETKAKNCKVCFA